MAKKKELNYSKLAKTVIANVGGKENIRDVRHCMTRLRFVLEDEGLADDEVLKATEGVLGVVKGGGEYMVIIGNRVSEAFEAVESELGGKTSVLTSQASEGKKKNPVIRVINLLMGAILPALNLICAGGILKGILTLLVSFGIIASDSGMYILVNAMGDAVFYFLPVVLGYNFAKSLGGDGFLGLLVGLILCYPTVNGVDLNLFGFTVNFTYTSSFLPVIAITAVAVPLSKLLKKYIHEVVAGFLIPVITLFIVIPLGFLIIGPAVTWAGNLVNDGINTLLNTVPWLGGMIYEGLYPVMVLFGVHNVIGGFAFMNLLSGEPQAITAMSTIQCFATSGTLLALYLKNKNDQMREVTLPAFISSLFGITEPALYGVLLPNMKALISTCIGCAVSGALIMVTRSVTYSYTGLGVFLFLGMADPAAPDYVTPILIAAASFAVSFFLTIFLCSRKKAER